MGEKLFTLDQKREVYDYLAMNMWRKGLDKFSCPVCGHGTITTRDVGLTRSASVTECSTPNCVRFTVRGL